MKKYLPIAALLGATYLVVNYLRRKSAAGKNLKFDLYEIKIDTQKTMMSFFTKIFYDIKLNVVNDENAAVNVKNIFFNIRINNINLGEIKSNINFIVPTQSEKQITIKANFRTLGALALVKDIVLNGITVVVNIDGYVDTDLGRVNINFVENYGSNQESTINGFHQKKNSI